MNSDPRADDLSAARARLSADANQAAKKDFAGLCVQCLTRNAVQILERIDGQQIVCDSFCSRQCGLEFAIQIANAAHDDVVSDPDFSGDEHDDGSDFFIIAPPRDAYEASKRKDGDA